MSPDNTNKRAIQFKNFMDALKQGHNTKSPFYTLKATEKRANLSGRLLRAAYRKDAIVAFRNSFVPSEIFYALDIVPCKRRWQGPRMFCQRDEG